MPALTEQPVDGGAAELGAALAAAGLPTEDLSEPGKAFYRFEAGGRPVGYAGYELHGEAALLRSVVVLPEARGKGYGRELTERVLRHAADAGARHAYLLTTSAESFFEQSGFVRIDRAMAPRTILETGQAATICATAAMLTRRLRPE